MEMERRSSAISQQSDEPQNGAGDADSSENSMDISPDHSDDKGPIPEGLGSWQTFAHTKFQAKGSHSYCCAPLQQPLMPKRDRADQLVSLLVAINDSLFLKV